MKQGVLTAKLNTEMRRQILENGENPTTYGEYAELMIRCMSAAGYAEGTQYNYARINTKFINPYIENADLPDIPSTELVAVTDAMYDENLSYLYRTIAKTILNHIFSFAYEMDRIDENICDIVRVKE